MRTYLLAVVLGSALAVVACSDSDSGDDGNNTSSSGGSSGGDVSSSSGGSSSGDVSSSSGNVSSGSSSGGSGNTTGADCKGYAPTSAEITPTGAVEVPAATGGTIADGTYQLTAAVVYGPGFGSPQGAEGAAMVRVKGTLVINGNTWLRGFTGSIPVMGKNVAGSGSGTFVVAGSTVAGEETCEDGSEDNGLGGFAGSFTVDGNTLTVWEAAPGFLTSFGATHIGYTMQKQ